MLFKAKNMWIESIRVESKVSSRNLFLSSYILKAFELSFNIRIFFKLIDTIYEYVINFKRQYWIKNCKPSGTKIVLEINTIF